MIIFILNKPSGITKISIDQKTKVGVNYQLSILK
jgi:hypothetical protein